jgi:cysteine-rich repeat protein
MDLRAAWVVCLVASLWLAGCGSEESDGASDQGGGEDSATDTVEADSRDTATTEDSATDTADTADTADEVEEPVLLCDDSCQFANNLVCDDGGPGATSDICPLGADCADCGPRDEAAVCGDGEKSPAEACDDGNTDPDDYCSPDCRVVTGRCGDGIKQPNEECEDGNDVGGDLCSSICLFEIPCTLPDACPNTGQSICDPETLTCAPIECDVVAGTGCAAGKTCLGQPVIVEGQAPTVVGACYTRCNPASDDCAADMTCVVRAFQPDDQGVCVRAGDAAEGQPCTAPPNHITTTGCAQGSVCNPPVMFPDEGVCERQCTLFAAASGCADGQRCGIGHTCLGDSADAVSLAVGQPCGIAARNYTACAPNDTAYLGVCIGDAPTCRQLCQMTSPVGQQGCASGEQCARFQRGADLGVCLKAPACGDGVQHPTEPCDGGAFCSASCQPNYSGACAAALPLTVNDITEGTTTGGSSVFGHNSCAVGPAPEALYSFTSGVAGTLSLRVGSVENRDVSVYVLVGCDGEAPTACADDFAGATSESLTVEVEAGQVYTIVVDGVLGEEGAFVMEALFE